MKSLNHLFVIILSTLLIQSCASTVKDKSPVENGAMALVKGIEMDSFNQFIAPVGASMGILIRNVDSDDNDSDKLEVLLSQGRHKLDLLCSYQIGGGYIKSSKGEVIIDVKPGYVYQLSADLNDIQLCNVTTKNLGLFEVGAK